MNEKLVDSREDISDLYMKFKYLGKIKRNRDIMALS